MRALLREVLFFKSYEGGDNPFMVVKSYPMSEANSFPGDAKQTYVAPLFDF